VALVARPAPCLHNRAAGQAGALFGALADDDDPSSEEEDCGKLRQEEYSKPPGFKNCTTPGIRKTKSPGVMQSNPPGGTPKAEDGGPSHNRWGLIRSAIKPPALGGSRMSAGGCICVCTHERARIHTHTYARAAHTRLIAGLTRERKDSNWLSVGVRGPSTLDPRP
jgi:hypothetical protein